ncbi:phytanoyl-CoA dioxygenase family protein [Streptomyces albiaxialis]
MDTTTAALTRDEIARFHQQGYLGPYTACTPEDMAAVRLRIDAEVLTSTGPNPASPLHSRHLDHRPVHDLVTLPGVLGRVRGLLGDDIVLWSTFLFNKEPGTPEVPWHQDIDEWPLDPPVNLSIWMAIDEVTAENSCVQIIPGSHRELLHHVPSRPGMVFSKEIEPGLVDTSGAIDMELAPGEFFLFSEQLMHHSNKNDSNRRRLGLSARYTTPSVNIRDQDSAPCFPGHACVLVSGSDTQGLNRMTEPPA